MPIYILFPFSPNKNLATNVFKLDPETYLLFISSNLKINKKNKIQANKFTFPSIFLETSRKQTLKFENCIKTTKMRSTKQQKLKHSRWIKINEKNNG